MKRGTAGLVRNNLQEQLEWLYKNHAAALTSCFTYSVQPGSTDLNARVAAPSSAARSSSSTAGPHASTSWPRDVGGELKVQVAPFSVPLREEEEMSLAELEALEEAEAAAVWTAPAPTTTTATTSQSKDRVAVPMKTQKTYEPRGGDAGLMSTASSNASVYFASSAADLDDDFDAPPPFLARHAKPSPHNPAASRKGKEKLSDDVGLTTLAASEEEGVIDLTQEHPTPSGKGPMSCRQGESRPRLSMFSR